MKWIIATTTALVLFTACNRSVLIRKPEPELNKEFRIDYGQTVTLQDGSITVQFSHLLSDSRCPKGVECVWAGNAKIKILFNSKAVKLNTNFQLKSEVHISGYEIRLISLAPYPVAHKPIKKSNYVATLLVTQTER